MDSTAGFILTGGRSSRLGRNKELLPVEGSPLAERTAQRVRATGLHRLSAAYHRRAGDSAEFTINHKCLIIHDLLNSLWAVPWPVADASPLENVALASQWGAR